jgi:hypothetical protein
MVGQSKGHPPPASEFSVVTIDTVEGKGLEGIVEELLPAFLLLEGRPKNEPPPDLIPNQLLDSGL